MKAVSMVVLKVEKKAVEMVEKKVVLMAVLKG